MRVKLRNGLVFIIHTGNSDINSLTEIFTTDGFSKFFAAIKDHDVVVDIGANMGIASVAAARKDVQVFAFEPNPKITPHLLKNITLNRREWPGDVAAFPYAIAGGKGKLKLYFENEKWGGANIFNKNPEIKKEVFEVDTIGLDRVFSLCGFDRIDVLKMDCEGAELEILGNAAPETLRRISKMLVECHPPIATPEVITEILSEAGFKVERMKDFTSVWAYRE